MKKILFFACAAMLTLASCNGGGNKDKDAVAPDDTLNTETTAGTDSLAAADPTAVCDQITQQLEAGNAAEVSTLLAGAQEQYQTLVNEGKTEDAAKYMKQIQTYITEHATELKEKLADNETVAKVVDAVKSLPTDAGLTKEAATAALDKVKSAVSEQYGEAAGEAVDKVKDAVSNMSTEEVKEAAEKVKEAASNVKSEDVEKAVSAVKSAKDAKEKVENAIDDAKSKAKDATSDAAKDAAKEAASKALDKLLK